MVEDSNVKKFQYCKMVGILTTAALFCWTNVQDCENTSSWYSGCYFDTPPLAPYVFRSLFRSHIAREMLTYCHAPAHSCSRAIPCEDRALAIRGFPRPAPCREECKGFYKQWTLIAHRWHWIVSLSHAKDAKDAELPMQTTLSLE